MDNDLRALLIEVAEGRLDPSDAEVQLDSNPTAPLEAGGDRPPRPAHPDPGPTRKVVVQASARPIHVVADHLVSTVSVDGPHSLRADGDTMVVDAGPAPQGQGGTYSFERRGGFARWFGQASALGVPVTVRVNPELAVHVELAAGALDVVGLRGPLTFSVAAGTIKVRECEGTLNGVIRAGSAKLDVRPVAGQYAVRVESGSVDLRLQPGSDVRLRARVELGEVRVKSADGRTTALGGEGGRETVVGAGTAMFDLDVVMGSAKVRTP